MAILVASITGFLIGFLGLIAPSMLNMTAAKMSITRGTKSGILFGSGASSMGIIQAGVAVYFANFLIKHPEIINRLKVGAISLFFVLSVFFWWQAQKDQKIQGKNQKGHPYLIGLGMSSLNMLAIPFYLSMTTLIKSKGWFVLDQFSSIFYIMGMVLGTFSLFSLYAIFAQKITQRASFIAKNINYILAVLFVILGIMTLVQVFFK